MGCKRTPGLYKHIDLWHIDKKIHGRRLCQSVGTIHYSAAELSQLFEAVNKVCVQQKGPALSVIEGFYTIRPAGATQQKYATTKAFVRYRQSNILVFKLIFQFLIGRLRFYVKPGIKSARADHDVSRFEFAKCFYNPTCKVFFR